MKSSTKNQQVMDSGQMWWGDSPEQDATKKINVFLINKKPKSLKNKHSFTAHLGWLGRVLEIPSNQLFNMYEQIRLLLLCEVNKTKQHDFLSLAGTPILQQKSVFKRRGRGCLLMESICLDSLQLSLFCPWWPPYGHEQRQISGPCMSEGWNRRLLLA